MKRALIIGLLLFGVTTQAKSTDPVENKTTYHCHHKAEYYAIRAELQDGKITIEQAQHKWKKAKVKLKKEEAK